MNARVLIADDSEIVLHMLAGQLTGEGFDVTTCLSGTEAIALAGNGQFDLFILDVMMPDLTGFDVTRKLRGEPQCASTPVLLLTSLDGTEDKVTGLQAGADDFLTKTVSDAELVARVRNLVAMGRVRKRQATRTTAANMLAARESAPGGEGARLCVVQEEGALSDVFAQVSADLNLSAEVCDAASDLEHLPAVAPDVMLVSFERALEGPRPLCEVIQAWDSPPAMMVVDSRPSTERRITAYQRGVEDYIALGTPREELAARVLSALRRRQRYRSLESVRDRALEAAITDQLTGLYNRGYFEEVLRAECKRVARYGQHAAVVVLDIDHFKKVNDTWGHAAGDVVLREVSRRLINSLRTSDLAARFGGEEFVVLLPSTTPGNAHLVADRVRAAIEATPFDVGGAPVHVTASLGVSGTATDGLDAARLVELADAALYSAKRAGRNRVVMTGEVAEQKAPARQCALCDATARLSELLAEDLASPLAAVRAVAHFSPVVSDEATNALLEGLRQSAEVLLERLASIESALKQASHEHR